MDDIFGQFRQTPPPQSKTSSDNTEAEKYVAFGTRDKVLMLRILIAPDLDHSPAYPPIVNVISDGRKGTAFVVVYPTMAIQVRGKNLQKIVFAIRNRMAEFIQKYDERSWPKPTDPNAPFIEFIDIQTKGGSEERKDSSE